MDLLSLSCPYSFIPAVCWVCTRSRRSTVSPRGLGALHNQLGWNYCNCIGGGPPILLNSNPKLLLPVSVTEEKQRVFTLCWTMTLWLYRCYALYTATILHTYSTSWACCPHQVRMYSHLLHIDTVLFCWWPHFGQCCILFQSPNTNVSIVLVFLKEASWASNCWFQCSCSVDDQPAMHAYRSRNWLLLEDYAVTEGW